MLHLGTYHSPDGVVVVTPERLRHWERQAQRLKAARYDAPSHFDHSSDVELLEPIRMDVLQKRLSRSAKATVGKLHSFTVAPDGKSAEVVLETLTPSAKESVESNAIFVSPVIFPEWKDGAGNVYRDVITSYDLVDHPVDYSQTSFVPAVRMGLKSNKPYILSGINMAIVTSKRRDSAARQSRMHTGLAAVRMGINAPDDDDDTKPKPDGDKPAKAAKPGGDALDDILSAGDSDGDGDKDAPPDAAFGDTAGDGYDIADQVLDLLAEFGVTLPDDTDDSNLASNLRVALTALLGSLGADDEMQGGDDSQPDPNQQQPVAAAPMIATMSLDKQSPEVQYAHRSYQTDVLGRIRSTLEDGKCTPAEADAITRQMGAVRLSLGTDGQPIKGDVEKWLDNRAAVPKGTFWTDQQRTDAPQRLSMVEPRKEWSTTGGPTTDDYADAVKALT